MRRFALRRLLPILVIFALSIFGTVLNHRGQLKTLMREQNLSPAPQEAALPFKSHFATGNFDSINDVRDESSGGHPSHMSTAKEIINGSSADLNDSVDTLDAHNSTALMDAVVAHGLVFVHLGKTAGSSITCMLDPSIHHSGYGNSQCSNHNKFHPSAISQHVVERVHLKPAPINTHDNFLITVRNPLDRIVSWFYYLHPSFPPAKTNRHKRGCDNFKIFNCWDNMQSLSEEGLDPAHNHAANGKIIDYSSNVFSSKIISTSNNHHHANQKVEECRAWAWDSIRGERNCWHNYFNFNFTYGSLVKEMTLQNGANINYNSRNYSRASEKRNKNIFVIRTEHLENDWTTIDVMLGGNGTEGMPILHKNTWSKNINNSRRGIQINGPSNTPNKTLSRRGRLNLCRALCDEIQIYKKLMRLAVNIDVGSEKQSLDELLHTCPNETREVKVCQ